jgi:tetratricopeptide (TPR) repeat protein
MLKPILLLAVVVLVAPVALGQREAGGQSAGGGIKRGNVSDLAPPPASVRFAGESLRLHVVRATGQGIRNEYYPLGESPEQWTRKFVSYIYFTQSNPLEAMRAHEKRLRESKAKVTAGSKVIAGGREAVLRFLVSGVDPALTEFNVWRYLPRDRGRGIRALQFATRAPGRDNPEFLRTVGENRDRWTASLIQAVLREPAAEMPESGLDAMAQRADRAFRAGRTGESLAILRRTVSLAPGDGVRRYRLATRLLDTGRSKLARGHTEDAFDFFEEARVHLARASKLFGNTASSRPHPLHAHCHYLLGQIHLNFGDLKQARYQYQVALAIDSNHRQSLQAIRSLPRGR